MKFKPGDKVKCISSPQFVYNTLKTGNVYTIKRYNQNCSQEVFLVEIAGNSFKEERFELFDSASSGNDSEVKLPSIISHSDVIFNCENHYCKHLKGFHNIKTGVCDVVECACLGYR